MIKKDFRKYTHSTVYEILNCILKLNDKYDTFNLKMRHKRLCNVLQIYSRSGKGSHANEIKLVRNTDGSFHNQKLVASKYNIACEIDMYFGSVDVYVEFMCNDLNMIDFDSVSNGYRINEKGVKFIEMWKHIEKLWPSTMSPYSKNKL